VVICVSCAGWAFSFGVSAPLSSLWLQAAGCSNSVIGWNGGVHYLGIALAALAVPELMRRGATRCPAAGMTLSAVAVAAFPWVDSLALWFAWRALHGVGGAMSLIPLETYVNRDLPPEHRARNFGFYAVALMLGYAVGNWAGLELYPQAPFLAFAAGGLAAFAGGALVLLAMPAAPSVAESVRDGRPDLLANFLSYGSAWSQGFLEAGMVVFLPLYLLSLAMTEAEVGWIMGGTMVGVLAFQVPIAWLGDRHGRRRVLLACYVLALSGLFALPACGPGVWLTVWLVVVGACSSAFYPLGLALLGERLPDARLAQANAWYLLVECLGCWNGSVGMGAARDWFGPEGMFAAGAISVATVPLLWFAMRWFGAGAMREKAEGGQREAA
jgi:MFS family permease